MLTLLFPLYWAFPTLSHSRFYLVPMDSPLEPDRHHLRWADLLAPRCFDVAGFWTEGGIAVTLWSIVPFYASFDTRVIRWDWSLTWHLNSYWPLMLVVMPMSRFSLRNLGINVINALKRDLSEINYTFCL